MPEVNGSSHVDLQGPSHGPPGTGWRIACLMTRPARLDSAERLVTARPTPWDRIIIVGCPFVVVAAGAHLTKSIGTMLAEAWPPQ